MKVFFVACALSQLGIASGFSSHSVSPIGQRRLTGFTTKPTFSSLEIATTSSGDDSVEVTSAEQKKQEKRKLIRQEGGLFAFNTKYGALNPFAIYYGLTAISLGIPWFLALCVCQLFYFVTGNKIDKQVIYSIARRWMQYCGDCALCLHILILSVTMLFRGECPSSSHTSGERH